ncbi:hypothetical protein GCM10010317_091240 [Streptomyces mirabilis]|nr:hypothetical protein GCM10010317_091240 [Streptomyces mirabilis]
MTAAPLGPAIADPPSPPLGLGSGLPVETAELHLPEGSRLVLYTNGRVEHRDRGIDTGLELLRGALAHPDQTPEQACQTVLDALLPDRPAGDIALLVARTRRLDPDRVADWNVPSDPAALDPIRAACARRLEAWGLDDIAFTTELILNELVTDAIRYGTDPIRLRAHFARRWGTRYTDRGKVIWCEQSLDASEAGLDEAMGDILLDQRDEPTLWPSELRPPFRHSRCELRNTVRIREPMCDSSLLTAPGRHGNHVAHSDCRCVM